jgi:ABC-2 type transport system permease protein
MQKIVKIAQREYLETVKAKTFIFSVVFTPTLIIGLIFFVGRLQKAVVAPGGNKRVAVVDLTGQLGGDLEQVFADDNASSPGRRIFLSYYQSGENADDLVTQLTGQVLGSKSDAYAVISQDVIDGHGKIKYFTQNPVDIELPDKVGSLVNKAIRDHRLRRHNLAPELIAELSRHAPVELVDVKNEQVTDAGMMTMVPFFFLFLMYAAVFGTSQWMLTSVLEEKNTRTIEVLLSAVSPLELMAGKIVGLSAVGLTLVAVWGTAGWASASWQGISGMVTADTIGFFAIYYILGFLQGNRI